MDASSNKSNGLHKNYKTQEEFLSALNKRLARLGITVTTHDTKETENKENPTEEIYQVHFFSRKEKK